MHNFLCMGTVLKYVRVYVDIGRMGWMGELNVCEGHILNYKSEGFLTQLR